MAVQHGGAFMGLHAGEMTGRTPSRSFSALLRSSLYTYLQRREKPLSGEPLGVGRGTEEEPQSQAWGWSCPAPHTDQQQRSVLLMPAPCAVAALHADWHSKVLSYPQAHTICQKHNCPCYWKH